MTRTYAIIGAVALVVIVIAAALVLGRSPGGSGSASIEPSPSASATESASPAPTDTVTPDPMPSPSPEPTLAAAPEIVWEQLPGPEPGAELFSITVIEGRWFAVGSVGPLPGIWFSDDAGDSWTPADVESTGTEFQYALVSDIVDLGDEMAAIGSWGAQQTDQFSWVVWRSADDGLTWTEDRREDVALRAIISGGPGLVAASWNYQGTTPFDSFVELSGDADAWERIESDAFTASEIHALAALGERLIAVGDRFGDGALISAAWYSDDGGSTWQAATGTDGEGAVRAVVPTDGGLVAVSGDGTPVARLSADGAAWTAVEMGGGGYPYGVALTEAGLVAVGTAEGFDPGPPRAWTSADGVQWVVSEIPGDDTALPRTIAASGSTVLAGGYCPLEACEFVLWRGVVADPALAP